VVPAIYHVRVLQSTRDQVADCDSYVFRTDRDEARERGTKYTEARGRVEPYTEEQIAAFNKLYEDEEIRGAKTR